MTKKIMVVIMAMMMTLCMAGCDKEKQAGSSDASSSASVASSSSASPAAKEELTKLVVYYPDVNATGLKAVTKSVKVAGDDKYRAAVEALLAGTEDKLLTTIFPAKAKLLGVTVKGDLAVVNFDKHLTKGFNGGSTGEEMLVGSLVNTLTEFKEIKRVQLQVEGQDIDSISGHLDLSKPVTRMPELIVK